jgi:2-hydroxy-6-oxonona-2,4-dienedioate hydrolase
MITYPFQVDETLTRVLEVGARDAPVVLLQHGFTSRADRWCSTMALLADAGYRTIAPDLPGHGFASKAPEFDHSVRGYANFISVLIDRLEIDRLTLVGTSLGGHLLAELACAAPHRIEQLVMVGSMGLEPLPAAKIAMMRAGLDDMSAKAMRKRLLSVFSDPEMVTDEMVREDALINSSPGAQDSLRAFACYLGKRYANDLVADRLIAADGQFPLLLVWGDRDIPAPISIGRNMRTMLPSALLAEIEGLSHTPYMEDPKKFTAIFLAFAQGKLETIDIPGVSVI